MKFWVSFNEQYYKMIENKILIITTWNKYIKLSNGGPAGFIAHNLVNKDSKSFDIYYDANYKLGFFEKVSKKIFQKIFKKMNRKDKIIYGVPINKSIKKYKYLFFHDTLSLYKSKDLLSEKQKIILQCHSPEMPNSELIALGESQEIVSYQKDADIYSFNRADVIVLPNENCLDLYNEVEFDRKKVKYVLSGARYNSTTLYPLDKSKINFLYIGRRNKIKGFDVVLSSFKEAYSKNKNLRLFIAGNGEKIVDEGIIDIGFTPNIGDWISSVDFIINANRQSYFDLSVIETLSLGTPIILAANFGHLYFKDKSKGIITYDIDKNGELTNLILRTKDLLKNKQEMMFENKDLYKKYLTDEKYFERFLDFFDSIKE